MVGVQTRTGASSPYSEILTPISAWRSNRTMGEFGIDVTAGSINDRILGNITPRPIGVEVEPVEVTVEGATQSVFVVTVPPSSMGAHQSTKTARYYRRAADGDYPMLDHEIRDVNNRRAGPILQLGVRVAPGTSRLGNLSSDGMTSKTHFEKPNLPDGEGYRVDFTLSLSNLGKGTANIAKFEVGLPLAWDNFILEDSWGSDVRLGEQIGNNAIFFMTQGTWESLPVVTSFVTRKHRVDASDVQWWSGVYRGEAGRLHPIWPSGSGEVQACAISCGLPSPGAWSAHYWLPWRVLTEGMIEMRGCAFVGLDRGLITVVHFPIGEVDWAGGGEEQRRRELAVRYGISS